MLAKNIWILWEDRLALWGFALLAMALPLSNLFMSLGIFIIAAPALSIIIRTIIFRDAAAVLSRNFLILLPILIWLLTFMGGVISENQNHWLWDVRVKLPILLLPLFSWMFQDVLRRNFLIISGLYISAVSAACIICLWIALNGYYSGSDIRNASVFISHIRFGLMMALVIPLLYFSPDIPESKKGLRVILFFSLLALYLCFEIITANLTGIFLMLAGVLFISFHYTLLKRSILSRFFLGFIIFILLSVFYYLRVEYNSYFTIRTEDQNPMDVVSRNGERYMKCDAPFIVEEGRITGRYIAIHELDSAWEARTHVDLSSRDARGQPVKYTLIRYLTSIDFRKDADGVSKLSDKDIQNILDGYTHAQEPNRSAIVNRMSALWYEWSVYKSTGQVSGHSVFQRVEFWRVAGSIIDQNFWWGVGPGDLPAAFERAYSERQSSLDKAHRLRAHNQFMTFWISFGVAGCLLLLCILIWPVYQMKWGLLSCFVLIVFLSCLTEDTLETQAGVCFYAFFSSVLMAAHPRGIDTLHSR